MHKEGLRKFFVGDFLHTCSSSRYGGAVSTMSAKVKEHKWLMHSVDKTKVQHLENALKHAEEEGDRLVQQVLVNLDTRALSELAFSIADESIERGHPIW